MRRYYLFLFFLTLTFGTVLPVNAQWGTPPKVEILSPSEGEVLQGVIPIIGSTNVEGLESWELSFSYINDSRETWFLIDESDQSFSNELLAQWDTTAITDGDYQLRLRGFLPENKTSDTIMTNLRVRNYTLIETSTPALIPTSDLLPTIEPTATLQQPTPTPLPRNPLEVTERDIVNSLTHGALTAFALIALVGLYASIRKKIR